MFNQSIMVIIDSIPARSFNFSRDSVLVRILIFSSRSGVAPTTRVSLSFQQKLFEANPSIVTVHRMSGLTAKEQQPLPEVRAEEVRLLISDVIKQETADADKEDLKSDQDKLVQGLKTLGNANIKQLKAELKAELEELLELMKTQEIYKKEGRPLHIPYWFPLPQCQTARDKNIDKFQIFATPAMQEFLNEAKKLDDIDELQVQMEDLIKF